MYAFRILLIEDDEQIRTFLNERLTREGYQIAAAGSGRAGLALIETDVFDAALLDINLPDTTGIEILEELKRRDPGVDAVVMTGYPEVATAIQALRLGASDYLIKPLEWTTLRHVLKRIVERRYLRSEVKVLRTRLAESPPAGELIGGSPLMQQVKDTIAKVAPTDSVILIEGESGTGKELIAGAIHRLSTRNDGPFVPVNCSAIPAELMESELFGHMKGAFSGASADSKGLFRSAEGGTLFLDEIGDLPLPMQPKLLRVLQEKELRPVGGSQVYRLNVRVVVATNQNLEAAVQSGKFRQDLFYRLNVVRIEPPVLRQIKQDIPLLAMHFVRKFNRRFGRAVQSIAPEALAVLESYDFPGNVRELENIIERAYALGAERQIMLQDLPPLRLKGGRAPEAHAPSRQLEDFERELIVETLEAHQNDKQHTARALGLSERTLYRRLKSFGLN